MTPPSDRPIPSLPELAAAGLVLLADVAGTLRRLDAAVAKQPRKTGPGGETLEETSRRVLERKFNPFQSSYGVDVSTNREALCREFGFGMRTCNKLIAHWKAEGYCEARRGTGVRLFAQRRS
jgi:hypothetical protein